MIDLKVDLKGFAEGIDSTIKAEQDALTKALNWTAFDGKADIQQAMKSVFDNPTPWTLNSIYVLKATPRKQAATVGIKDSVVSGTPAAEYLRAQVFGGDRAMKRAERHLKRAGVLQGSQRLVVARSARKNRHGNITKGRLSAIVKDVRQGRRAGGKYFVMRKGKEPIGIFQRKNKKTLVAEFGIENGALDYRELLNIFAIVRRTRDATFKEKYQRALQQELARR